MSEPITRVFRLDPRQGVVALNQIEKAGDRTDGSLDKVLRKTELLAQAEIEQAKSARLAAAAAEKLRGALGTKALESEARALGLDAKAAQLAAKHHKELAQAAELEKRAMGASASSTRKQARALQILENQSRETKQAMGSSLGVLKKWAKQGLATAAIALSLGSAISAGASGFRQFTELEQDLVSVAKTTDLTKSEIAQLRAEVSAMSTDTSRVPVDPNELLALGEAAGQLGVEGVDNIELYIETLGKLDKAAADLRGPEAAMQLQQILNVSGEGAGNVGRLASVIVRLGNEMAATEGKIAHYTSEVARNTSMFGLGSTAATAWGAALVASGARAEGGGTAIGRSMRRIQEAVSSGGQDLERIADIAQVSAEDFADAWRTDANEAMVSFVSGLGRFGSEIGIVLKEVGLSTDRTVKVLAPLATKFEILAQAQGLAADESENITALNKEAARAFGTTGAAVDALKNQVSLSGAAFGEEMAPAVAEAAKGLVIFLRESDDSIRSLGQVVGAVLKVGGALAETGREIFSFLTAGRLVRGLSNDIGEITEASKLAGGSVREWQAAIESLNSEGVDPEVFASAEEVLEEARKRSEALAADMSEIRSQMEQFPAGSQGFVLLEKDLSALAVESDLVAVNVAKMEHAIETARPNVTAASGAIEEMTDALEGLRGRVVDLTRQADLMERFGLSASEASEAVKLVHEGLDEETVVTWLRQISEAEERVRSLGQVLDGAASGLEKLRREAEESDVISALMGEYAASASDASEILQTSVEEVATQLGLSITEAKSRVIELFQAPDGELPEELLSVKRLIGEIADEAARLRRSINEQRFVDEFFADSDAVDKNLAAGYERFLNDRDDQAFIDFFFSPENEAQTDRALEQLRDGNAEVAASAREDWIQTWAAVNDVVGDVFDGLDGRVADVAEGVFAIASSFQALQDVRVDGRFTGDEALAGFSLGSSIGGVAQSNLALGGGQAGGLLGGAGGIIASAASLSGPAGMALSFGMSLLGTLDLFASGGDDAVAAFEQTATGFVSAIRKVEGELRPAINQFADAVLTGFEGIIGGLGGSVNRLADIEVKLREEDGKLKFRVLQFGERIAEFADESEAVAFAVQKLLQGSEIEGLSDVTRSALRRTGAQTFEELQLLVGLLGEIDSAAAGAGPMASLWREFRTEMVVAARALRDAGVAEEHIIALEQRRTQELREQALAGRESLIGISGIAKQTTAATQAILDYNAGLDVQRESYERQLAALEQQGVTQSEQLAGLGDVQREIGSTGHLLLDLEDGFGGLDREMLETIRRQGSLRGQMGRTARDTAALREALDAMGESLISDQAIAETWAAGLARGTLELIGLLQQVHGEDEAAALQQQAMTEILVLQLVAAKAAIIQMIEASGGLLTLSLGLETVLGRVDETVEGLLSGELSLDQGQEEARGGGGNRREQRAQLRESLAILESGIAILGGAAAEIDRIQQETAAWVEEARRLGKITAEEIALYRELQAARQDLVADDAVLGIRENLARAAGDEELLAELTRQRQTLEVEAQVAQIAALVELGVVSETVLSEIRSLADDVIAGLDTLSPDEAEAAIASLGLTLEQTGAEFAALGERLETVRQAAEEGAISQERLAEVLRQAGDESALSLGEGLLAFADRYYGAEEQFQEERQRLAQLRHDLELAQLRMTFELARELGVLTERTVQDAEEVFAFFESREPDLSPPSTGSGSRDPFAALPLDDTRGRIEELATALGEVREQLIDVVTDHRSYADVLQETQSALTLDVGDRLVRFASRYYGDSIEFEEVRLQMELVRFEIERRNLGEEIRLLEERGLLLAGEGDLLLGLLGEIEARAPDLSGSAETATATTRRGGSVSAADPQIDELRRIREGVAALISEWSGFNGHELAREVRGFLDSYRDTARELEGAISVNARVVFDAYAGFFDFDSLSTDEIREIVGDIPVDDAMRQMLLTIVDEMELDAAFEAERLERIDDILAQARGETLPGYAQELLAIHTRFEDMREALELLGATQEDVTSTYAAEQAAVEAYMASLTGRAQDFLDRLNGSLQTPDQNLRGSIEELQGLRAQIRAGDLSAIDPAVDLAERIEQTISGGSAGAARGIRELLAEAMREITGLQPEDVLDPQDALLSVNEDALGLQEDQLTVQRDMLAALDGGDRYQAPLSDLLSASEEALGLQQGQLAVHREVLSVQREILARLDGGDRRQAPLSDLRRTHGGPLVVAPPRETSGPVVVVTTGEPAPRRDQDRVVQALERQNRALESQNRDLKTSLREMTATLRQLAEQQRTSVDLLRSIAATRSS